MTRLTVFAEDEGMFALRDPDGAAIGSIRGDVVTFMGFDDVEHAVRAAREGSQALLQAICGAAGRPPAPEPDASRLEIVYDGGYEWISDGTLLLARLIRPSTSARGDGTYGIAFVFPTRRSDAQVIAVAHAVHDALHGQLRPAPSAVR
ncbi:MAG TPA: hypothetical protein VHQ45_02705 [Gemmatimonadaceae bacterium]|jgi:hypothetical protein|nr:hypothetical protein [Gemmatimonadaceae bacterium]